jgi:hypothetical protein
MFNVLLHFADDSINITPLPGSSTNLATGGEVKIILGIVFGIIGALALLMITISGFRYITSAGDPQKAAGAKNAIIYALVGLAVAISAEGIVAFVVGKV